MEAPKQNDDVVKAPFPSSHPHDLRVKPGEDGPLPQLTGRRVNWSIINLRPPVLAPGSRPWKKPPLTLCRHAEGLKSFVIMLRAPQVGTPRGKNDPAPPRKDRPRLGTYQGKNDPAHPRKDRPRLGTSRSKKDPTTPRKDRHRRPQVGTFRGKNDPTTPRKDRHQRRTTPVP